MSARIVSSRTVLWTDVLAATVHPGFDSYQRFTDCRIPVAVLERRADS